MDPSQRWHQKKRNAHRAREKDAQRVRKELGPDATDEQVLQSLPAPPRPNQRDLPTLGVTIAEQKWNAYFNFLEYAGGNLHHFRTFGATGRPRLIQSKYRQHVKDIPSKAPAVAPTSMAVALGSWTESRRGEVISGGMTYAAFKVRQMMMAHMLESHFNPEGPSIADDWGVYNRPPRFWNTQWLPIHRAHLKALQGFIGFWLNADDTGAWHIDNEDDLIDITELEREHSEWRKKGLFARLESTQQPKPSRSQSTHDGDHGEETAAAAAAAKSEDPDDPLAALDKETRHRFRCRHTLHRGALAKYLPEPLADLLQLRTMHQPDMKSSSSSSSSAPSTDRDGYHPDEHGEHQRPNRSYTAPRYTHDAITQSTDEELRRANPLMMVDMAAPNHMKVETLNSKRETPPPYDFIMYFVSRVFAPLGVDGSPTSPALTERHNAWSLGDAQAAFIFTGGTQLLKRLGPETEWEESEFYKDHPFNDEYTAKAYDGTTYYPRRYLNRREIAKLSKYTTERNLQGASSRVPDEDIYYEGTTDGDVRVGIKGLPDQTDLVVSYLHDDDQNLDSQWIHAGRPRLDNMNNYMAREQYQAHAAALVAMAHAPPVRLLQFEHATDNWEQYLFKFLSGTYAVEIPCRDPKWTWTVLPMHVPSMLALPPDYLHTFITRVFAAVRDRTKTEDQSYEFAAVYVPQIHPAVSIQHNDPFLDKTHTHLSYQGGDTTDNESGARPRHGEGKVYHAHAQNSAYFQFHVDEFTIRDVSGSRNLAFRKRAERLYNTALEHAHQLLTDRFTPEEKRPARVMLPPQAPTQFLQRALLMQFTVGDQDIQVRRRGMDAPHEFDTLASVEEVTPYATQWLDKASHEYPLEHISSIDLRQTTRMTYVRATPEHSSALTPPDPPAIESSSVPADTVPSVFVLYREALVLELAADTTGRVLRQYVLNRTHDTLGNARDAGTLAPDRLMEISGRIPHVAATPNVDFGERYVAAYHRAPRELVVLSTQDQSAALTPVLSRTTSLSSDLQSMGMDHEQLTYVLRDSGDFVTIRNWAMDSWAAPPSVEYANTASGTTHVSLLAVSYNFHVFYDAPSHTLYAQFRSPANVPAPPTSPNARFARAFSATVARLTSLAAQRVGRRTYILYGTETGTVGAIELEWDATNATQYVHQTSIGIDIAPRPMMNTPVESIAFGANSWRVGENTFGTNLQALYTLDEDTYDSGTNNFAPVSSLSASTTEAEATNGSLATDTGVFPRVATDAFELTSTNSNVRFPASIRNGATDFTYSFWFRRDGATSDGNVLFQSHTTQASGYHIEFANTTNDLELFRGGGSVTTLVSETGNDDVDLSEWTLLTVSANTSDVTFMVNDDVANRFIDGAGDNTLFEDVYLGAPSTQSESFRGFVDYVGVWTDRNVHPLDIHLWYNAGRGFPPAYIASALSSNDTTNLSQDDRNALFYTYVGSSDGEIHLWDIQHNERLWEYQSASSLQTDRIPTTDGTSAMLDVLPLRPLEPRPPLRSRQQTSSRTFLAPHDVLAVRHVHPFPAPQILGRSVELPQQFTDHQHAIVADDVDYDSANATRTRTVYAFPTVHVDTSSPVATDGSAPHATNVRGTRVAPFARLQSREQWSMLLTGDAWTIGWWTRTDAFLFADADRVVTQSPVTHIPLTSVGTSDGNVRVELTYDATLHAPDPSLTSQITHYFPLDRQNGATDAVTDVHTATDHANLQGATFQSTAKLPLNAPEQIVRNQDFADAGYVLTFPPLTTGAGSAYVALNNGTFDIADGAAFTVGCWVQPRLDPDRLVSDAAATDEVILRTNTVSTQTNYFEIRYDRAHTTYYAQAHDSATRVTLSAQRPDENTITQLNSGGHEWDFLMVSRDTQGVFHLYRNNILEDTRDNGPTGPLADPANAFFGSNAAVRRSFQGALRDVSFWNTDLSAATQTHDVLYNYGQIRTYPFTVPFHEAWELRLRVDHPLEGPGVVDERIRTPIHMHTFSRFWQAFMLSWRMDWDTSEHVLSVWHGTGHMKNSSAGTSSVLNDTSGVVVHETRLARDTVASLFPRASQLWMGATPSNNVFHTPHNGYPSPAFAHVAVWTRELNASERAFFVLADRVRTHDAGTNEDVYASPLRDARPLTYDQYGQRQEHERAHPISTQRDIPRHPHRRWLYILSHQDMPVPIATTTWPVMPDMEKEFERSLRSRQLPSDLRKALDKNGGQVAYYHWGANASQRPDTFGNQDPTYVSNDVFADKRADQTPLSTSNTSTT